MDDQPAIDPVPETPVLPSAAPPSVEPPAPTTPLPPKRRFGAWPLLWIAIALEVLFLVATVLVGLLYGSDSVVSFLTLGFYPLLAATCAAFSLLCWRQFLLRRSILGWIFLLLHLLGVGLGLLGAKELWTNAKPYSQRIKADLAQLMAAIEKGGSEPQVAMDTLAVVPSEGSPYVDPEILADQARDDARVNQDPSDDGSISLDTIQIPDVQLGIWDTQLVDGMRGIKVLVKRQERTHGLFRTVVLGDHRLELIAPDAGTVWTAAGPVRIMSCVGEPEVVLAHVGMCPKVSETAHPVNGLSCLEPLRWYDLAMELHQPVSLALPMSSDNEKQLLKTAREWSNKFGCKG